MIYFNINKYQSAGLYISILDIIICQILQKN